MPSLTQAKGTHAAAITNRRRRATIGLTMHILLIEDDLDLGRALQSAL